MFFIGNHDRTSIYWIIIMISMFQVDNFESKGEETLSLIPDLSLDHMLPDTVSVQAGIVSWSPPNTNWNPWTGSNIDEGQPPDFSYAY